MAKPTVDIEVTFALPDKQLCLPVTVVENTNVQQAILLSGIMKHFSEIDLTNMKVGIFGKACKLNNIVEQGDRVEIYRSLLQNPMDARRNRASG